mmetsp:Transcript_6827/g.14026  ORF Transcript_6827/g.14026 Transcript_6827/m.14026 type:complete len:167 (+) Transcript_6827:155-655(+)
MSNNDFRHPFYQRLVDSFPHNLSSSSASVAKKVSIYDNPRVHYRHYIVEDDDEMSYSPWYDRTDYTNFRLSIRSDVLSLRRVIARNEDFSEILKTGCVTPVGIIHLAVREVMADMVACREAHNNAVLNEHRRQVQEGKQDPELLRNISSKFSKKAKMTALAIAQNI